MFNNILKNKIIIVFGGAGSIGSELVRQLSKKNLVVIFDIDETRTYDLYEELNQKKHEVRYVIGDIRDEDLVKRTMENLEPDIVFQCAARKHVSPMEEYPMEAVSVNIQGTWNIINNYIGRIINISTDKVINGESIMGLTKKIAEKMVKNAGGISVRFGNVMGSRGSVLPIWQSQVERREDLTVTDERCERFMMTIPEACELVIEAVRIGKPGQIFILDMGKPVKILDLAKRIVGELNGKIKMIGLRPGETLKEKLMTEEEEKIAKKVGKFWII